MTVTGTDSEGDTTESGYALVSSIDTVIERDKPDSSLIENSVSSMWKLMEHREVIASIWSEYIRLLSNDFRKVGELVLSKSIQSIQPGRVASDIVVYPRMDLDYS